MSVETKLDEKSEKLYYFTTLRKPSEVTKPPLAQIAKMSYNNMIMSSPK